MEFADNFFPRYLCPLSRVLECVDTIQRTRGSWMPYLELGPHRRNCDHSRIGGNMFNVQDDPSANYRNYSGIVAFSRIKFQSDTTCAVEGLYRGKGKKVLGKVTEKRT
jgi:hypothetical protein